MPVSDQHMMTIFAEALERTSADARDAYLGDACAGEPDLRRRVEDLLQAHGAAGGFLAGAQTAADLPHE